MIAAGPAVDSKNLVFGYDTGRYPSSNLDSTVSQRKYFKGRPTINLATNTPSQTGWQGTYTLIDSATKTFTIETRQSNAATTSAWRSFYWSVSSYIGSYVTISGDVEFVSETNATFRDISIGQGNTGPFPQHIRGSDAADRVTIEDKPLSKISMTWSGIINSTGIVGFTQWINNVTANDGNSVLKISNVQIEAISTRTPFINGTRSSTASLLDLAKTANIDVANVSFDSDGLINFDGTDDLIEIDSSITSLDTSILSIEIVFRTNTGTGAFGPLVGWHYGRTGHGYICIGGFTGHWPNESISFYNDGTGATPLSFAYTNGSSFLGDANYHHAVFVLETSNYRIFVDGQEVAVNASFRNGSASTTMQSNLFGYGTNPKVGIGVGSSPASYFNGKIPVVRMYNTALTASDVAKNYQTYKTRFGM